MVELLLPTLPKVCCCLLSRHHHLTDEALHGVTLGYAALIRAYVSFILSKLRFHRHHPEFNGLFEYEEYISLKNINDPNEG